MPFAGDGTDKFIRGHFNGAGPLEPLEQGFIEAEE
jgi:hypothetical protein